jgi:hypothetical protein
MRKDDKGCVGSRHKSFAMGTLKDNMRQAGITVDEFVEVYIGK